MPPCSPTSSLLLFPCLSHHCLHSPVTVQVPASQDVELKQLDSQTLEESLHGELGGRVDFIEHDT